MYDGVAILKEYGEKTFDEYGNPIPEVIESEVFVQPRGVYQSELYNASQLRLKPLLTLYISNREDYHGQKVVEFEGVEYSVIRVDWTAQRDGISLVCEERINDVG